MNKYEKMKEIKNKVDIGLKINELKEKYEAINWNEITDDFSHIFWHQFLSQFWIDTEVGIARDNKHWMLMTNEEKDVFKKNFINLTMFDTLQSEQGMPKIKEVTKDKTQKAVLGFMEMMESIHAKAYSTIFTTLMEKFEIDELFEWGKENKFVQFKAAIIDMYYKNATLNNKQLYMAMVASVYLESFLFYSGFFYPLYLAGQGRMMATADMINLIIRDEAIHGVYVGLLAQNLYEELTPEEKIEADEESVALLDVLIENEVQYTHEIYGKIGLAEQVIEFVKYNANKARMNIGKQSVFENIEINPIVEAGLDTETKTHDFFSNKGNGYIKANIEELTDKDFDIEIPKQVLSVYEQSLRDIEQI